MAERSLGYITPGTTPDPLTANQTDPTAKVQAHSYRVWHVASPVANTGGAYVGNSSLDAQTGDGLTGILYPIGVLGGPPLYYESPAVEGVQNPHDLSQIYIQADNQTDTFLITYVEA